MNCTCTCRLPDDFVVYGNQFETHNEYKNPLLRGTRFRVLMRGLETLLKGVEWKYIEAGGFEVMFEHAEFDSLTIFTLEFY